MCMYVTCVYVRNILKNGALYSSYEYAHLLNYFAKLDMIVYMQVHVIIEIMLHMHSVHVHAINRHIA